jgi:integrase
MTVRRNKRRLKDGKLSSYWMADVQIRSESGEAIRERRVPRIQTRAAAEALERQIYAELEERKKGGNEGPKPSDAHGEHQAAPENLTLLEFADLFMKNYVATQNKRSEQLSKERILRNHLLPMLGSLRLKQIGTQAIDSYIAAKKSVLSVKSVNNHLAVLVKMLRVAGEWEMLNKLPRVRFMRAAKPRIDFLDADEVRLLLNHLPDDHFGPMIVLALNTGLRIGEILALRWDALDLAGARINVWYNLNDDGTLGTPKSGRSRDVPLNGNVLRAMAKVEPRTGTAWVFFRPNGEPLTRIMAYRALIATIKRANLNQAAGQRQRRLGWHMLRHTFASRLVMRGVPLRAIQELLGHASMDMTLRYAHLAPAFTRDAVSLLND